MKKYLFIILLATVLILPSVSLAQFGGGSGGVAGNNPFLGGGDQVGTYSGGYGGSRVGNNVNFITRTFFCSFSSTGAKIGDLLKYVTCIIANSVIPLIFALAVVIFIWGVVQYVINTDEEAKRAKGRQFMIWGIIALTVMVSVWGLVAILRNTFGIKNVLPTLPTTPADGTTQNTQ